MKLKEFIDERVQRIVSIVENSTIKIVKKEMRKLKRDLQKEMLTKLKKSGQNAENGAIDRHTAPISPYMIIKT